MVNTLKDIYDRYFNTLRFVGRISTNETNVLSVLSFLKHFICSKYVDIKAEDIEKVEQITDKLIQCSCLVDDFPHFVKTSDTVPSNAGLVTQSGLTIISNGDDRNIVPQIGNDIKRFSDFTYQSSIGTEDFIVGYDSVLNQNIRVNMGSLVTNWQPI